MCLFETVQFSYRYVKLRILTVLKTQLRTSNYIINKLIKKNRIFFVYEI